LELDAPKHRGGKGGQQRISNCNMCQTSLRLNNPPLQPVSTNRNRFVSGICFAGIHGIQAQLAFCLLLAGLQKLDCLFFQNVTWHGSGGPKQCSTYRPQAGATCSIQSIAAVHCISATNWFPLSVAAHKGNGMGRAEGGLHGVS